MAALAAVVLFAVAAGVRLATAPSSAPVPRAGQVLNEDAETVRVRAWELYRADVAAPVRRVNVARRALLAALDGPRNDALLAEYAAACRAARHEFVRMALPMSLRDPAGRAANGLEAAAASAERAVLHPPGTLPSAVRTQVRGHAIGQERRMRTFMVQFGAPIPG